MMPAFLFVCLGNICRSPAAEFLLSHLAVKRGICENLTVASCGTGGWNIGGPPDGRMCEEAALRGFTIGGTAQVLDLADYYSYDLLLVADHSIREVVIERMPSPEFRDKIVLMTIFSQKYKDQEIPDPYIGGREGFRATIDILEDACNGLLDHYYP